MKLAIVPRKSPRAWSDNEPIIRPPETVTVDYDPKPVLHLPGDKVLVRRPGF